MTLEETVNRRWDAMWLPEMAHSAVEANKRQLVTTSDFANDPLQSSKTTMPIISNPKGGIEVEVFWSDQDVIECQFRCSNGKFSGLAEIYLSHDDLPRMASALEGFPRNATDSRELELGTFNPAHANGGVRLHCYCKDSVGHAVIEVKLRGDACRNLGEPESVALILPIEAAGVDSFVTQVRAMDAEQIGSSAFLPMVL